MRVTQVVTIVSHYATAAEAEAAIAGGGKEPGEASTADMAGVSEDPSAGEIAEALGLKVGDTLTISVLGRPIEGEWPYVWLDATYVKVRQNGRIVSVAVIVAVEGCASKAGRNSRVTSSSQASEIISSRP